VQVTAEDQIERPVPYSVDDSGKVTEQKSKRSAPRDKHVGPRPLLAIRHWIDTYDHRALPPQLEFDLFVAQERRLLQIPKLRCPRERVARDCDIVIAEDDEWAIEPLDESAKARLSSRTRDEIAGDANNVRLPPGDPRHRLSARSISPGKRCSEMEVGEMRNPKTVECSG